VSPAEGERRTAWLFPGQDAFGPTTGLAWAAVSEPVRRNLDLAERLCGVPLLDRRARRRLDRFTTAVIQPLLVALCLGIAEELRDVSGPPDLVAGHSLGEVSAWAVACAVEPAVAIEVAHARGVAMEAAAVAQPGGMRAVRGTESEIATLLARPGVELGARNSAEDWVLTGTWAALGELGRPVPVTGPWHSAGMRAAEADFRGALPTLDAVGIPMILEEGGRLTADASALHRHLVRQLTHPADAYAMVQALARAGITDIVTVGPGRVLRAHVRAIAPAIALHATDTAGQLPRIPR
jgi:[acyl-carrier-protein] S-malonyltransferase